MVNFNVSREDAHVISEIAHRAVQQARKVLAATDSVVEPEMLSVNEYMMDITATHANGCPLRLRDLLLADDFNFSHDVFGIRRHLNRHTGQLDGRFLPRFAHPERVSSR